jgi:RNA polymerase sigma-70 factor (ECF subfamily)
MTDSSASVQSLEVASEAGRDDRAGTAPPGDLFHQIFHAEAGYVWKTLRRLGVREADAEDLAHEVFLVLHRQLPTLDLARPLRPWLFAIAYRAATRHRRRGHVRHEVLDDRQDPPDGRPGADDQLAACQAQALVLEALQAIDPDRRAVFVMHEIDGVPVPGIAEALAVPLNTAYSRLRLAREDFAGSVRRIRLQRGER